MSDAASTTVTATPDSATSIPPLANSPDARTADGTIRDVNTPVKAEPAPAEPQKGDDPAPKPEAAPDAYTFKAPEGFSLDEKLIAEVTPIFKDLGLTQDAAQRLVDMYSKTAIAQAKRGEEAVTKMRTEWRDTVSRDPELGPKLETVKADIGRAITLAANGDTKLIGDFKAAMDLTGAGDNPAIIKMINRLSAALNEGTHVSGQGPSPHGQVSSGRSTRPSVAAALYPNLPHN